MLAARLTAIGTLSVEEVPRPAPGANDLLVKVEACGICGSDRHMFRGEYPTALPVTLGHEFSGIVEEAGAEVGGFRIGTRVTGDPNIACGQCEHCLAGRPNLCPELTAIGVFRDGGFAEYVIVPESQAAALPPGLNPLHGAFCEPVSCCLHAIDVARIPRGGSVAVLGGGVIGLLMVELAKRAGAGAIVLSTRQEPRRAAARELGATHVVDPGAGDPVKALAAIVPGGVDVVFECAGVAETFVQSVAMARRGGTIVVFGVMPQGEVVSVSPYDLLVKELRLESAWLNPLTHKRAAELIASGALSLDRLITRTVTLGEVPAAIAAKPAQGEIKIIATP